MCACPLPVSDAGCPADHHHPSDAEPGGAGPSRGGSTGGAPLRALCRPCLCRPQRRNDTLHWKEALVRPSSWLFIPSVMKWEMGGGGGVILE